jgi:hypothetical protein
VRPFHVDPEWEREYRRRARERAERQEQRRRWLHGLVTWYLVALAVFIAISAILHYCAPTAQTPTWTR